MFSTRSANDAFAAKFTDPLRAVLAGNISYSGPVFETVGRLWSAAEIALEQLPEVEAQRSTEGAPLADDVKDAVSATTEALWRAVDPKARPASGERVSVYHTTVYGDRCRACTVTCTCVSLAWQRGRASVL